MAPPSPDGAASEPEELRAAVADARERALVRRAGLAREFDAIVASADTANADDEHDPEGQTIGFERAQVSALLAEVAARLVELDRADARLRAGTFGRCKGCSGLVTHERLLAAPTTTTCIDCATSAERVRHRTPDGSR